MSNAELAETVDTSDEWIEQRTGIKQRYIAGEGETTSTLATEAARAALKAAGLAPSDIDLIIVATSTPDYTFPSVATQVQANLGIVDGAAFDLQAVCTGFVYAVTTADKFLLVRLAQAGAGDRRRDLLAHPRLDRPDDLRPVRRRGRRARPGGAGEPTAGSTSPGVIASRLRADGRHRAKLYVDGGPSTTMTVGHLRMEGKEVFRHAVGMVTDVILGCFADAGHRRGGDRLVRAPSGQPPHHRRLRRQARHSPHRRS